MSWLYLNQAALSLLTFFILSLVIVLYFPSLKDKTKPTWLPTGAFAAVAFLALPTPRSTRSGLWEHHLLNAIEAMPKGGRLVMTSKAPSPEWVAVSFIDTGVGMPEENLGQLFEPLFTTKAKGIGLGMAVTKTLVEGHGGAIEVESDVGKGSTFTVRLLTRRGPALSPTE